MGNIKAIVYGVGTMGKAMTKLMVEKGVVVVGAVDVVNVGEDLGEVAGLGHPLNVKISDDADAVVGEREANIAVVAVCSRLEQMYPYLERCINNGLNVITTAEEAFYPWTISPELGAKLDKLARKHGVTVTGGGQQDACQINLIRAMTGESHTIESIVGTTQFDLNDFGPLDTGQYPIGIAMEEFDTWVKEHKTDDPSDPSRHFIYRATVECLISTLGLTIKSIEGTVEPVIADVDTEAKRLGKVIKKGDVRGLNEILNVETAQGIRVRHEGAGKVYVTGETDTNEWYIKGVPDLYMGNGEVPALMVTATGLVNRIPDIINAEPGFITVDKLPPLSYRVYPLHFYLHERSGG